jgi:Serine endopeptidase inhibitors
MSIQDFRSNRVQNGSQLRVACGRSEAGTYPKRFECIIGVVPKIFVTSQKLTSTLYKEIYAMRDKTESSNNEGSEQNRPFFARFLEGQDTSKNSYQTLKFPSDRDDIVWYEYMLGNNGPQQ